MIVSKVNFDSIAKKFHEALGGLTQSQTPRYISIWPEHDVEATRLVAEGNVSYSISIEGEEITRLETIVGDNRMLYIDNIETISTKLMKGSRKYIGYAIKEEVGKILDIIREHQFTASLFSGGLSGTVYSVITKHGTMKFIDIYQNDKLIYSAPHSAGYEDALVQVLEKVLKESYNTNGLVVNIP